MWRPYFVWGKRFHRVLRIGVWRPRRDRVSPEFRFIEVRLIL